MFTRSLVRLVAAAACLGALAAAAGSVAGPAVPSGVAYDVVVPAEAVLELPTGDSAAGGTADGGGALEVPGEVERRPLLFVGAMGVLILGGLYFADGVAGVFVALTAVALVAAARLVTTGAAGETASRTVPGAPPSLAPVAIVALAVALAATTLALVVPPDHPVRRRGRSLFARLAAVARTTAGQLRRAEPSRAVTDDEVHRAWLALARRADADPTQTPGEVAAAAREAGYPADAVAELRDAFEAVRYGGEPLTPARAERVERAITELSADDGTPDPSDGEGRRTDREGAVGSA